MRIPALFAILAFASSAYAQLTITDFDSSTGFYGAGSWTTTVDQLTFSGGIMTVAPVSSGTPDDSGYFLADIAQPFGGALLYPGGTVTVSARIDSGNGSNGFTVNFYNSGGIGILSATFATSQFSTSDFTSVTAPLNLYQGATTAVTQLNYFGIAGAGTNNAFRFSFDQISVDAIPEPSTYVLIAMGLGLVGLAIRRRAQRF